MRPFPMKKATLSDLKVGEHFRLDVVDVNASFCEYTVVAIGEEGVLAQNYGDPAVTRYIKTDRKIFRQ